MRDRTLKGIRRSVGVITEQTSRKGDVVVREMDQQLNSR